MIRPSASSLRNSGQVAQSPTRLELAISTRGAHGFVRHTPTGLPDCTSRVSSSSRSFSVSTIASNASQLRAARPVPPYTTRSSGRSATSGSRLFISMRSGASVCQLFALSSVPRGARTSRGAFIIVPLFSSLPSLLIDAAPAAAAQSDSPSGEGTSRGCHRATTPGCVGDNMCA